MRPHYVTGEEFHRGLILGLEMQPAVHRETLRKNTMRAAGFVSEGLVLSRSEFEDSAVVP